MIVLKGEDVRRALPMDQTIEGIKRAYAALSGGRAELPQRLPLKVAPREGISFVMPAYVRDETEEALAVKVVSVFPKNRELGVPILQAAVLVLDPQTARPVALLEGGTLTAIRTGGASGAATDLLARHDSRTLAIFGAGVQGRTQLEAVCTVRCIETVWIYDPDPKKAEDFMAEMRGKGPVPAHLVRARRPQEAVAHADIICAATTSHIPVFEDADLRPGVHINGVGSFTQAMREIPPETIKRSLLVVDSRPAALEEAGDLIQPIEEGLITAGHIHAELGEIILGRKPGRNSPTQITCFKSVGLAVQDAVAAQLALENARLAGLGQEVPW